MLRNSPINFLVSLVIGGLLWLITGFIVANYLGDTVSLIQATTGQFIGLYRTVLGIAAILGLLVSYYWYFYGAKESTSNDLGRAKSIWTSLFFFQLSMAVGAVVALFIIFRDEVFTSVEYLIFFAVMSAHTYVFYWVGSLLMSPTSVKYIPWGK